MELRYIEDVVSSSRIFRSYRWLVWVLILAFFAASVGFLPSSAQVAAWLDFSMDQAYPCANGHCGCATATQCWTNCCCHTPRERLAWAMRNGVLPPEGIEFPESDWIAAANGVKPGSATCGACVTRIKNALASGTPLVTAGEEAAIASCCSNSPSTDATCCGVEARNSAAPRASCCSDAASDADDRVAADLPCLSPLGCKGASALTLVIPPPMLLPAAIPALVLTWSRIDRVVIVGMHAHSRALDVTAPPPRAR